MLAVSLDTHRSSLYEILRLATGHLDIQWSISVAAFCKARARFSPGGFIDSSSTKSVPRSTSSSANSSNILKRGICFYLFIETAFAGVVWSPLF